MIFPFSFTEYLTKLYIFTIFVFYNFLYFVMLSFILLKLSHLWLFVNKYVHELTFSGTPARETIVMN